jgi:hypothetical protein
MGPRSQAKDHAPTVAPHAATGGGRTVIPLAPRLALVVLGDTCTMAPMARTHHADTARAACMVGVAFVAL